MRIFLLAASALALSVGTSSLAQGNGNRGGGGGGGKPERVHQGGGGKPERADRGGRGGGGQQAERGNRGQGGGGDRAGRGNGQQRQMERAAQRGPDREMRGNGRGRDMVERKPDDRGRGREERRVERGEQRDERRFDRQERRAERGERRQDRRAMRVEDGRELARLRWEPNQSMGRGCPPGLAKKNNGCMPPGQAKQMAQTQNWYRNWWAQPDTTDYYYDDGYLVRLGNGGGVESFLPLLGGALWPGQTWPDQFQAASVDDYHLDYFGLQDNYDYRYADGAIYGVDPTNNLIQQVVGLIAGDDFAIGQQMPDGYGVYNVPYEFRDQYQDTNEANYRYSDGYVYQVDPTTQLIQAAIQLIT